MLTRVLQLVEDNLRKKSIGQLLHVGLDATDKVRIGLTKHGHEGVKRILHGCVVYCEYTVDHSQAGLEIDMKSQDLGVNRTHNLSRSISGLAYIQVS